MWTERREGCPPWCVGYGGGALLGDAGRRVAAGGVVGLYGGDALSPYTGNVFVYPADQALAYYVAALVAITLGCLSGIGVPTAAPESS